MQWGTGIPPVGISYTGEGKSARRGGVEQMRGGDPCGRSPVELSNSFPSLRAFPINGYSHWDVH